MMAGKRPSDGVVGEPEAKRHRAEDITGAILVKDAFVGGIVGKGGMNIRSIREQSAARITINDAEVAGGDRPCSIVSPNIASVFLGAQLVCMKLYEQEQRMAEEGAVAQEVSLGLSVPNAQVGVLIGRGGETRRAVTEGSGARVIFSKMEDRTLPRQVTIEGYSSAVAAACQLLHGHMLMQGGGGQSYGAPSAYGGGASYGGASYGAASSAPTSLYAGAAPTQGYSGAGYGASAQSYAAPSYGGAPAAYGGGGGGGGGGGAPSDRGPMGVFSITIIAQNKMVGSIIGKGGQTINHLRESTGAQLRISKNEPGVHQRSVNMSGAPESVVACYDAVQTAFSGEEGHNPEANVSATLQVTNAQCGAVIGKGGETIKGIREASGAKVLAPAGVKGQQTDRDVIIDGPPSAVRMAIGAVVAKLVEVAAQQAAAV